MRGIDPYAQRAMLVLLIAAASGAACTRTQARTAPEMPALVVPLPPPRLVEPITNLADASEEVPAPENEPPAPPAATPAVRPPAPDPPRAAVTPPTETPPAPPASPPPVLQTIPAVRESAVERAIRADLDTAAGDLKRVDYRLLTPNARANFDQAQRFISQADAALREKNYVFAETVASKAATLAAQVRTTSGR